LNILVIGAGGREHALAWKLAQSPIVTRVFAAPGNPGIAAIAQCIPLSGTTPADYLAVARQHEIDLTIVGPEIPLIAGVVDAFRAAGLHIFGPTAAAAQLEGSKVFAKNFFARHNIPTARFATATSLAEAETAINSFDAPFVLKADGLAAGKGVLIVPTKSDALAAAAQLLDGSLVGDAGSQLVIEEFLTGEEVSFIAITDGINILPLKPAQDHKAIFDGDLGPNTGGMGAYVDDRILTPDQHEQILSEILRPTVAGMRAEGTPFSGFLFAGLMMTPTGPKILEYNVRLGDPETQPLMLALQSDLAQVLSRAAAGNLADSTLQWSPQPTLCVVLAAHGYPAQVRTGDPISGIPAAEATGAQIFHAGTTHVENQLLTAGGRVLAVTTSAPNLRQTIDQAYAAAKLIHFDGLQIRKDIGQKGLKRW
jgi:phosphoribosylamine---glycine ligase